MLRVARPKGQRRWTLEKEKERQAGRGRKRRLRFFFPDAGQCFFCFLSLWLAAHNRLSCARAPRGALSLFFFFAEALLTSSRHRPHKLRAAKSKRRRVEGPKDETIFIAGNQRSVARCPPYPQLHLLRRALLRLFDRADSLP